MPCGRRHEPRERSRLTMRGCERVRALCRGEGAQAAPGERPGPGGDFREQRRFVLGAVAGTIAVVAAVGSFNALIDPYGFVGTAVFPTAILSDRSTKACLAERLRTPPRLVVYGSSRAMKVEPAFLQRRTGLASFNAAVSSATPADAWAFANFMRDRFPSQSQRVLWLVDVESFRPRPIDSGLLETPALARYFSAKARAGATLASLSALLSWHTAEDSLRLATSERASAATRVACTYRTNGVTEYTPDGFRAWDFHDRTRSRGIGLRAGLDLTIGEYSSIYRNEYPALSDVAKRRFERTLALMSASGTRPLLVLTPVHPRLLRVIGPLGWNRRHAEVVRYLMGLRSRFRFDLLDASRIARFGGRPRDFYDGVHLTEPNVRRLLDWALGSARGSLPRA